MQTNAPRCLTLDLRLFTADKLAALYATYSQQNVQEAMRAIHGEASAAKYTCLASGLDKICRHRWPALARGKSKPTPASNLYGPTNADVVAELEAKERQEAEERFRQTKSKSHPAPAAS